MSSSKIRRGFHKKAFFSIFFSISIFMYCSPNWNASACQAKAISQYWKIVFKRISSLSPILYIAYLPTHTTISHYHPVQDCLSSLDCPINVFPPQITIEQNRCAMAGQGYDATFLFLKTVDRNVPR